MRVAVKQLPAGRKLPPAAVVALEAEAALQMRRLAHDHVVRVFGFAVSTADPAHPKHGLVARLHEPLQAVLERAAAGDGPPPPLAWRLSAVHLHTRHVAHGDFKPANVMLISPETGSLLQLTGFGLAREVGTGGWLHAGHHGRPLWPQVRCPASPPPGPPTPPLRPPRTPSSKW